MDDTFDKSQEDAFLEWLDSDGEVSFDIHARNVDDYAFLQKYVPSLVVSSAGGMMPFQAEGLMFGLNFYYRERGGYATLRLANTQDDCYDTQSALYSTGVEVEEFRDQSLWVSTLLHLIPQLERHEFCYRFPHRKVKFLDSNDEWSAIIDLEDDYTMWVVSYGETQEEALKAAKTFEVDDYLTSFGWSVEAQKLYFDLVMATLRSEPLEVDSREWPTPEPVFEVR